MMPDLPTLGIRFDVDRIGDSSYGIACWKIFWQVVNPVELAGADLYEGDTAASMAGNENVFCIAIQSTSQGALGAIRAALANHGAFNAVCSPPRFLDREECRNEPLVRAGSISAIGDIIGEAWNARPGLASARGVWK
jgi:hypothetical protein